MLKYLFILILIIGNVNAQMDSQDNYCIGKFDTLFPLLGLHEYELTCSKTGPKSFQKIGCWTSSCKKSFFESKVSSELKKMDLHYLSVTVPNSQYTIYKSGLVREIDKENIAVIYRNAYIKRDKSVIETLVLYLDDQAPIVFYRQKIDTLNDYKEIEKVLKFYNLKLHATIPQIEHSNEIQSIIILQKM